MSNPEIIGYTHIYGRKVPISAPDYEWCKQQKDLIICNRCGKLCKTIFEEVDLSEAKLGEPSSDDYPLYKEVYERAVIKLEDDTYECTVCEHKWNPQSLKGSTNNAS